MKHGLASTYGNRGCRCESCREAHRLYHREVLRKMRSAREQGREIIHGLRSSYENWACRCAECREAKRLADAADRSVA